MVGLENTFENQIFQSADFNSVKVWYKGLMATLVYGKSFQKWKEHRKELVLSFWNPIS